MINFTTLFDSFYLDKGLCLYKSLERVCDDFKLYIFCFDAKSKHVLEAEKLKNIEVLYCGDLEQKYPQLLELKEERSKAEYCWTCTPASIEYVLDTYNIDNCTYIDADLYFFKNPSVLINELNGSDKHIIITPHRFTDSVKDRYYLKRSGKYCVEFNYFDNSDVSREALKWWRERCFEWCYHKYEAERMGDQKYLEKFPILFSGVHELENKGGGVAPWNLNQYRLSSISYGDNNTRYPILYDRKTKERFELIFYHFQNIRYLSGTKVNISSETNNKELKNSIYIPYLREIEDIRKYLKIKYNVTFSVKKTYSSNKIISFLQGNMLRFKVKSISDLIDLDKI